MSRRDGGLCVIRFFGDFGGSLISIQRLGKGVPLHRSPVSQYAYIWEDASVKLKVIYIGENNFSLINRARWADYGNIHLSSQKCIVTEISLFKIFEVRTSWRHCVDTILSWEIYSSIFSIFSMGFGGFLVWNLCKYEITCLLTVVTTTVKGFSRDID